MSKEETKTTRPATKGTKRNATIAALGPAADSDASKKPRARRPAARSEEDIKLESEFLDLLNKHTDGILESDMSALLPHSTMEQRAILINSLATRGRMTLHKVKDQLLYKKADIDVSKLGKLDPSEMLIYQLIEKEQNNGLWIRHMKERSGLQPNQLTKILKTLVSRKLVKCVKSAVGNKKVYMLIDLEPSREVTGMPWDVDPDFIVAAYTLCLQCVTKSTRHRDEGVSVQQVMEHVRKSGVFTVPMREDQVQAVLMTLVYDGVVEIVPGSGPDPTTTLPASMMADVVTNSKKAKQMTAKIEDTRYRPKQPLKSPFGGVPCAVCPVSDQCRPGGPVSPESCEYYRAFMDF